MVTVTWPSGTELSGWTLTSAEPVLTEGWLSWPHAESAAAMASAPRGNKAER